MKYYKVIGDNPLHFEHWRLPPYNGYVKDQINYKSFYDNEGFASILIKQYPTHLQEVSKQEYLLHKVKELKAKILDKNNGFYILKEHYNLFLDLLDKCNIKAYHNIRIPPYDLLYYEQCSMYGYYSYRAYVDDKYIKQYNLNLINFKDLIDEIKEINNEI